MIELIMWWILAIFTIIGGLAAMVAYFRGRKIQPKQALMREPSGTMPLDSPFYKVICVENTQLMSNGG